MVALDMTRPRISHRLPLTALLSAPLLCAGLLLPQAALAAPADQPDAPGVADVPRTSGEQTGHLLDDEDLGGSGNTSGTESGTGTGGDNGTGSDTGSTSGSDEEESTTGPDKPTTPPPAAPDIPAGVETVDSAERKVWLGEFSSSFGTVLARGACDVTGDGKPDVISGNLTRSEWKYDPYYWDSPNKGWVSNVTGAVQIVPGGTPGAALTKDNSITIVGPRDTGEEGVDATIGLSVACLGDTNGDGVDDLAVGSHTMGRAWVLNGGPGLASVDLTALTPAQGFTVKLPAFGAPAAHLAPAGDVNGDGLADLAVVHTNLRPITGAAKDQGVAYVVAGARAGQDVDLTDPLAENARVIARVVTPLDHLATSFTAVGDVNKDGRTDFVLTDYSHSRQENFVHGRAWLLTGVKPGARIDLGQTFEGAVIEAVGTTSLRLGIGNSVAPAGDVDGDGFGDFVIGFDGGNLMNVGRGGVALVHGNASVSAQVRISPEGQLDDVASALRVNIVRGAAAGDGFGYAVDVLPGAKGTGLVAVGAQGTEGGNGRSYVFPLSAFNAPVRGIADLGAEATVLESPGAKSRSGRSVAFVGSLLGGPTLAVGGDGVIHDDLGGDEGWAHAAHVMAVKVKQPAPAPDPQTPGQSSGSEGGATPQPTVKPTAKPTAPAPAATQAAPAAQAKKGGKQLAKTGLGASPALAAALTAGGLALLALHRRNRVAR